MRSALLLLAAFALPAAAAEPEPEIRRPPATPQATGTAHSVRTIPEACIRLEGVFTGDPARPYAIAAKRSSPRCRPRARFVDADRARPSPEAGWRLNDLIRVPSAACPGQQAVVRVWRRPGGAAPPALDAQGRARLYLGEAMERDAAQARAVLPLYAAGMRVEGTCAR